MPAVHVGAALLPGGWARDVRVAWDAAGRIVAVETEARAQPGDHLLRHHALLAAPSNLHSHAFQRAMAGLTERRGPGGRDSFWTWRGLMYRFLEQLTPEDVAAIAAQVQVETLEAGFAAMAEFHYLHHAPGGGEYADLAEMSGRIVQAAAETGIGLTLLPVLYHQGGVDGRPLAGGQLRFGTAPARFGALVDAARGALAGLPGDAGFGLAPHSLRAVAPGPLAELAAGWRGPLHLHAAEQVAEVEETLAILGARPVDWLLDHMPVGPDWCLIHATQMTPAEVGRLAASGAVAGLCPITEANLGDGIFAGPQYLEAGGVFGIGSDSNVCIGLASELRQLEYSQRLRDRGRAVLCAPGGGTGRRLWDGALAGGARALGRASGGIAPGLWADLVALDTDALALAGGAGDQWIDRWLFASRGGEVAEVWAAGRHVVSAGRHRSRGSVEAAFRAVLARLRTDF